MSDEERLAVAHNAAANGRLIVTLLFALSLSLALIGRGDGYFYVAFIAILALGASYIADVLQSRIMGVASIILTIVPFAAFLIMGV